MRQRMRKDKEKKMRKQTQVEMKRKKRSQLGAIFFNLLIAHGKQSNNCIYCRDIQIRYTLGYCMSLQLCMDG